MGPRVVIVGASLAGLRSAEAVLAALPGARITIVGDEAHRPYNRPPLSKEVAEMLAGADAAAQAGAFERIVLRHRLPPGAVDWRLGCRAEAVEPAARSVRLGDGTALPYDWLIAATGLSPRRLPLAGAAGRRHVLRGFDDAVALGAVLRPGARLLIAGAGFIGCEVAATATKLGLAATIVEPADQPMRAALGAEVAAAMAAFHRARGVTLHLGRSVAALDDTAAGVAATLDDGRRIEATALVEAVGSQPNVAWLAGAGLDLSDGVLCDRTLTAVGAGRILAVGDVARFANPLFGTAPRRVEHWCVPSQTARRAAETIAAREAGGEPPADFAPMPSFWSDQHGLRLQSFGAPAMADEIRVIEGALDRIGADPCLVEYRRAGVPVGLLGLGAPPALIARHRPLLDAALARTLAA